VDVVSLGTRLLSREPVVPDTGLLEQADLQALALANGTGTVVSGSYYLEGDSVQFLAHVMDAGTGEELAALEPVWAAVGTPAGAVEVLRDRVMTTLATLTDPRLAKWMRYASKPPTFEAYTEFVEGVELHTHGKFPEAIPHFLAAAALDSNFTMASLWAVFAYANSRQPALRDSIGQALNRRRSQLAPLDRLLLDHQLAFFRGDYHSALEAMRRFVEIAPGSEFLYKAGYAALLANRPREAIGFLTQADPASGWLRGWYSYWYDLTRAYHRLGDHRNELKQARRGARQYPDKGYRWELRALAALGRVEEVNTLIEEYEARDDARPGEALRLKWEAIVGLRRHGHPVAASTLLDRAIDWFENTPSEWTRAPPSRHLYSRLLFLAGRLAECRWLLEGLVADNYGPLRVRAQLGAVLARLGDPQEALRAVGLSETGDDAPVIRAAIAAQQGERARAVELLRERGVVLLRVLHSYAEFEPLWDYPPFQELMRPKG
jgi:tetratricopeptide (TPR) repeat protein